MPEQTPTQYLVALYDHPEAFQDLGPEEMQQIVARYQEWAGRLGASGHLVGGQKLEDGSGRVLSRSGDRVRVLDGPYSEAKEVLGGYFLIQAASYDEAVELTRDCPHLDYGTLELRAIDAMAAAGEAPEAAGSEHPIHAVPA